jgi:hypothetical protein
MVMAAAPMVAGLAMKIMRSRKQKQSEAAGGTLGQPDGGVTNSSAVAAVDARPPMTDRYDHRAQEDRLVDAHEDAVIDQPIQPGAALLRAEVTEAERRGDLDNDPSGTPTREEP